MQFLSTLTYYYAYKSGWQQRLLEDHKFQWVNHEWQSNDYVAILSQAVFDLQDKQRKTFELTLSLVHNICNVFEITLRLFFIVICILFIDSTIGFKINVNRNSNINNNGTNIESNWAYSNASLSVLRQMSLLCLFLGSQMFVLLIFESLKTSLDDTAYYVENIFIDCANMFVWLFITIGRIINIVYLATAGSSDKNSIISIIY